MGKGYFYGLAIALGVLPLIWVTLSRLAQRQRRMLVASVQGKRRSSSETFRSCPNIGIDTVRVSKAKYLTGSEINLVLEAVVMSFTMMDLNLNLTSAFVSSKPRFNAQLN